MKTNVLHTVPQIEMTFEPNEAQAFMRLFDSLHYLNVEDMITESEYQTLNDMWHEMWHVLDELGVNLDAYFGEDE